MAELPAHVQLGLTYPCCDVLVLIDVPLIAGPDLTDDGRPCLRMRAELDVEQTRLRARMHALSHVDAR